MKYLFSQRTGNITLLAILENPEVKDGVVHGKKVANFAGLDEESYDKLKEVYKACQPVDFYAGGASWAMEEYTGDIIE